MCMIVFVSPLTAVRLADTDQNLGGGRAGQSHRHGTDPSGPLAISAGGEDVSAQGDRRTALPLLLLL